MEGEARPPQDREALRGGQEGPCLPAARPPGQEAKGAQEAGLWPGALPAHAGPATSHWPTGRGHGGGLHLPLQGGALAPAHALASTTHTHTGPPLPGSAPDRPGAPRPAWRRCQASHDPGRRSSHPGARGHTPDACPPAAASSHLAPPLQAPPPPGRVPASPFRAAPLTLQSKPDGPDTSGPRAERAPVGWPSLREPSSILRERNRSQSGTTAVCSGADEAPRPRPQGPRPLGAGPSPGTTARRARSGRRRPQPSTGKMLPPASCPVASLEPAGCLLPDLGSPADHCPPLSPVAAHRDPGSEGHSEARPGPALADSVRIPHTQEGPALHAAPTRPSTGWTLRAQGLGQGPHGWPPGRRGVAMAPGSRLSQATAQTPRRRTPGHLGFPWTPPPRQAGLCPPGAPSAQTLTGLMPPGWCPRLT